MTHSIVIMGLGNVLYGDEGLGVHAVERLYSRWDFSDGVEVIDGGTQGHSLLTYVERAERLLVLDAVDFGLEPGTVTVREGKDIPMYLTSQKVSPHQNSFSEVLALAELRGRLPEHLVLVGMQPERMALGRPLSDLVESQLERMEDAALAQLRRWGVEALPATEIRHLYHPNLRMEAADTP